jgi:hypothetical protein
MEWEMPWYSVPSTSVDALIAGRHFGMRVCYLRDDDRVFETYWTTGRGCELMGSSYAMLDMTVYGRQEAWEDSPRAGRNGSSTQRSCRSHGTATRRAGLRHRDLAARPSAGLRDRLTRSRVLRLRLLEELKDVLRARCRPQGEQLMVGVCERPSAADGDETRVSLFR